MKIKRLSNKELRTLSRLILDYGMGFKKGDEVYSVEFNSVRGVVFEKKILFFYYNDEIVPSLHAIMLNSCNLKNVFVDMGAVRFVVNGADIMRPGIKDFDTGIVKDKFVVVRDINNEKPLCIGISLYSGVEIGNLTKGRV